MKKKADARICVHAWHQSIVAGYEICRVCGAVRIAPSPKGKARYQKGVEQ